jgi:hypothetical protein
MRKLIVLSALLMWAIPGVASYAGIVLPLSNDQFDTGWTVELMGVEHFDGSVFVGLLGVTNDQVPGAPASRRILIEIDKIFDNPHFNDFGLGQTAALKFTLANIEAPDYSPTLVLNDEKIDNNTGTAWTDFHMLLEWDLNAEAPNAQFNPDHIFTPGVSGNPFQTVAFAYTTMNDVRYRNRLNFLNGIVPAGSTLTPGSDGSYVQIDTSLSQGQSFILKEYPTIPEPATLAILGVGGILLARRNRRQSR